MNENNALLPVRLEQTASLSSSLPFTKVVFQFLMHSCFIFNLIVEFLLLSRSTYVSILCCLGRFAEGAISSGKVD